jgi:hypothetical protein
MKPKMPILIKSLSIVPQTRRQLNQADHNSQKTTRKSGMAIQMLYGVVNASRRICRSKQTPTRTLASTYLSVGVAK